MTQIDAERLKSLVWDSENLMDNPPIIEFPYLKVGDTFTFKDEKLTVKSFSKNGKGFFYEPQNKDPRVSRYYMSFYFFINTPYFKGKYGRYKKAFII